jgi:hypothetical protein
MRGFADGARTPGVVGLQRGTREPAFDDGESARTRLRIVGQPDPRTRRRTGVERGETGIEGVVVDADRHQHDGQCAHFEAGAPPAISDAAARAPAAACAAA